MWAMSISCISIWTKRSNVHPRPGSRGVTARARSSRPLGRSRGATASLGPPRRCRTLTGHGARGPRRKAKGAATLVKGRVRRAVVSTIYLNRVRYRGRMTLTDTDRYQDVTHSQPQAGPHPRDTRRDTGIRVYGRTYTLAGSTQVRGSAPGAGPVCRHPNRLLQRGTGTQRLVHNGQYSNSYSLGPPRRAALGAAGR